MLSFRQRLTRDEGFTLIELLVVLMIIGILLSIAIPSYLGFQKSAEQTAAASDARQAVPDAEAFFVDNGNTYLGISAAKLQTTYDSGMKVFAAGPPQVPGIVTVKASTVVDAATGAAIGQEYCISADDNGNWSHVAGPGGIVKTKETTNLCTAWTSGRS